MKCSCCQRKVDFDKKWSFCFDCSNVFCASCGSECNKCVKPFHTTYEEDLQRMIKTSKSNTPNDKKYILYFFYAVYNLNGFGCDVNYENAFLYFSKSADKNFFPAITCLAKMYGEGIFAEKNIDKAFSCYLKASFMGSGEALFCLSLFYIRGDVVKKSTKDAIFYLEQAAKKEYEPSYIVLSGLYRRELNFDKADFYYRKHLGLEEQKIYLIE